MHCGASNPPTQKRTPKKPKMAYGGMAKKMPMKKPKMGYGGMAHKKKK